MYAITVQPITPAASTTALVANDSTPVASPYSDSRYTGVLPSKHPISPDARSLGVSGYGRCPGPNCYPVSHDQRAHVKRAARTGQESQTLESEARRTEQTRRASTQEIGTRIVRNDMTLSILHGRPRTLGRFYGECENPSDCLLETEEAYAGMGPFEQKREDLSAYKTEPVVFTVGDRVTGGLVAEVDSTQLASLQLIPRMDRAPGVLHNNLTGKMTDSRRRGVRGTPSYARYLVQRRDQRTRDLRTKDRRQEKRKFAYGQGVSADYRRYFSQMPREWEEFFCGDQKTAQTLSA